MCPSRWTSRARNSFVCHASTSSVMPLNVLPSMMKSPVAGSRAPMWMLLNHPLAAGSPLDGEHDEIERARGFDLEPGRTATPGGVRGRQVFHHHALVSARDRVGLES